MVTQGQTTMLDFRWVDFGQIIAWIIISLFITVGLILYFIIKNKIIKFIKKRKKKIK